MDGLHLRCSPVGFLSKGFKKSTQKRLYPLRVMPSAAKNQDLTVEFMLGQKLGSALTPVGDRTLQAFRLRSLRMLLKPLARLKKADASLNLSQGVLDEIVGEGLGVLPEISSILAVAESERLTTFTGGIQCNDKDTDNRFDIMIYDGTYSEETLRMVATSRKIKVVPTLCPERFREN